MFTTTTNTNTPFATIPHPFLAVLMHPENIAQQMGAQAHHNGYKQSDNPFGMGQPTFHVAYRRAWNCGWMKAHWEREER